MRFKTYVDGRRIGLPSRIKSAKEAYEHCAQKYGSRWDGSVYTKADLPGLLCLVKKPPKTELGN